MFPLYRAFTILSLSCCLLSINCDDDTSVISRLSRSSLHKLNNTLINKNVLVPSELPLVELVTNSERTTTENQSESSSGSDALLFFENVEAAKGEPNETNAVRKIVSTLSEINNPSNALTEDTSETTISSVVGSSSSSTSSSTTSTTTTTTTTTTTEEPPLSSSVTPIKVKLPNSLQPPLPKISVSPVDESLPKIEGVTQMPKREGGKSVNLMRDALLPVLESMIVSPISSEVTGEMCRNHSRIFEQELGNFKLWAVQMVDASSKFPTGVLAGSTYQLGHFDECLGVSVHLPHQQHVLKGQYCLAEVEFSPLQPLEPRTRAEHWAAPDFNTSAWIKVKSEQLDRRILRRDVIHWAMCIPDSCSSEDLRFSMDEALQRMAAMLHVRVDVRVNKALCQVNTDFFSKLSLGDFAFVAVVLIFVLLVALGTAHDMLRAKHHPAREDRHGKLLQCFSAKMTLSNWLRVDPGRDMIPLHTVRFGCMIGILMGHHFIADASSPLLNSEFLEQTTDNPFALPLLVIPALVVDSFFLVSGFLTTRFLLIDLDRNKLKVFAGYMHRYLRLTPVYMLMVAYHATLLGKLGTGPLWPVRLARDQHRCSKNWWTNLLYINNYVNTDELCLFQSWHLACELHFSLIAPILVILLWRRPRSGIALIAFLGAATITALYVITSIWDLDPILMSFISVMSDLSADATFRLQYIPTHTRGLPYLIGIVAAYLHYKNPFEKKQLSQRIVLFAWGVTLVLMTSPMVTAVIFYSPNYNPTTWMAALYAAVHRIPWCLGQAWVIVVGITGNAGFLQKILDFKMLVPLSRLSYCVFLVHNAVQLFMSATVRSPHHLGPPTVLWMLIGDIAVTYAIALIIHLLFEAPIQRLDKTFFTKADNKTKAEPKLPSKITAPTTDSNGNGWRQNMAFEKSSENIATIYQGNLVSTVLNSELR